MNIQYTYLFFHLLFDIHISESKHKFLIPTASLNFWCNSSKTLVLVQADPLKHYKSMLHFQSQLLRTLCDREYMRIKNRVLTFFMGLTIGSV